MYDRYIPGIYHIYTEHCHMSGIYQVYTIVINFLGFPDDGDKAIRAASQGEMISVCLVITKEVNQEELIRIKEYT